MVLVSGCDKSKTLINTTSITTEYILNSTEDIVEISGVTYSKVTNIICNSSNGDYDCVNHSYYEKWNKSP